MASGGGGEGEPEFQIAPMVDVLLVLLIFFMSITTTQVLKVDKNVNLPVSMNSVKKDTARNEAIVNVRWDALKKKPIFVIDDREFNEAAKIVPVMKEMKKRGEVQVSKGPNPEFRVVVRGDREAKALHINQVIDAAGEAGIAEVSFSVINREG